MRNTKKIYLTLLGMLIAMSTLAALSLTSKASQTVSSYRDCDADTIIKCGAITEAELLQKYDANVGDIQNIYSRYGISRGDLAGATSQIQHGTVYQDGRVVVGGKTVATNAYSVSRERFSNQSTAVTINGTTVYEGPNMSIFARPVDAYVYMRNGQFYRAVLSSCGNPLMATPVASPAQPLYTCDSLTATKIDRINFKFTTAATAKNGAEIVSYTYDFGDGKTQTVTGTTVNHTYTQPGTYTVKVTVSVKVNGETKTVSGEKCQTTVKVENVPVTPLYACDSLTVSRVVNKTMTYAYTLSYTAEGGATLKKVVYDFGDGSIATYASVQTARAEHTYVNTGAYNTTATLYFDVKNGETTVEKSDVCEVSVTISPEICETSGRENSRECVVNPPSATPSTPVTPVSTRPQIIPAELPQTGIAGALVNGGIGLGSLTAAGYCWVISRKSLLSALLNR